MMTYNPPYYAVDRERIWEVLICTPSGAMSTCKVAGQEVEFAARSHDGFIRLRFLDRKRFQEEVKMLAHLQCFLEGSWLHAGG
jgi:hypothetical protein